MKLPYSEPHPSGTARSLKAKAQRDLATEVSRLTPQAHTRPNGEEADHAAPEARYPANFTKGLAHDEYGLVSHPEDYRALVRAINAPDPTLFDEDVVSAKDRNVAYHCAIKSKGKSPKWRGWESPRAGHVYELQGPDAGATGMAPAPRVGSSELAAEMAEVYALALLRDVPFTVIAKGGGDRLCPGTKGKSPAQMTAKEAVDALKKLPFYSGKNPVSSTPHQVGPDGLNAYERNRRAARLVEPLSTRTAFRGSTKGAYVGPYVSQFMLMGSNSRAGVGAGGSATASGFPGTDTMFDERDGFVSYGSIVIDQRSQTHLNCLDYMTDWCSWLDVQNGADVKDIDQFEDKRRFITTPRDLATYVHYDALYEAYLNACLIMLGLKVPQSKGFPEPSSTGRRDAFATFGGPHILSLVCEVATRCLKAVRRQKFNYHRRCRPETIAGRFALVNMGCAHALGCTEGDFSRSLDEIRNHAGPILDAVVRHNVEQNALTTRDLDCTGSCLPSGAKAFDDHNILLPMAFPEGSPMHPAYGAGHATVAGGCVTMLKAFFEMFESCDGRMERPLLPKKVAYVPNDTGTNLKKDPTFKGQLTIQGELDKLAANISIGRNMAGVHYYSDYYDSLRMGERIAIGILLEQAPTYGDAIECTFTSFDGDHVVISGEAGSCPSLSVIDRDGARVSTEDFWLRHVTGREFAQDL